MLEQLKKLTNALKTSKTSDGDEPVYISYEEKRQVEREILKQKILIALYHKKQNARA